MEDIEEDSTTKSSQPKSRNSNNKNYNRKTRSRKSSNNNKPVFSSAPKGNSNKMPKSFETQELLMRVSEGENLKDLEDHVISNFHIQYISFDATGSPNSQIDKAVTTLLKEWVDLMYKSNVMSSFTSTDKVPFKDFFDYSYFQDYIAKSCNLYIVAKLYLEMVQLQDNTTEQAKPLRDYCNKQTVNCGNVNRNCRNLKSLVSRLYLPPTLVSIIDEIFGFKQSSPSIERGSVFSVIGVQINLNSDYYLNLNGDDSPVLFDVKDKESFIKESKKGCFHPKHILNFPPAGERDSKAFTRYVEAFTGISYGSKTKYGLTQSMFQTIKSPWSLNGWDTKTVDPSEMKPYINQVIHNLPVISEVRKDETCDINLQMTPTSYVCSNDQNYKIMLHVNDVKSLYTILLHLRSEKHTISSEDSKLDLGYN